MEGDEANSQGHQRGEAVPTQARFLAAMAEQMEEGAQATPDIWRKWAVKVCSNFTFGET